MSLRHAQQPQYFYKLRHPLLRQWCQKYPCITDSIIVRKTTQLQNAKMTDVSWVRSRVTNDYYYRISHLPKCLCVDREYLSNRLYCHHSPLYGGLHCLSGSGLPHEACSPHQHPPNQERAYWTPPPDLPLPRGSSSSVAPSTPAGCHCSIHRPSSPHEHLRGRCLVFSITRWRYVTYKEKIGF